MRLMARGVTGLIDHSDFLVFLSFLSHVGGGGEDMKGQTDRQEVLISTPWLPGSPGLR